MEEEVKKKVDENGHPKKGKKGKSKPNVDPPIKLTEDVFRGNTETQGGQVKGRNEVLKMRMMKFGGTQPHVNCRVQTLGLIMKNFDDTKIKWVKELGMGGLLHLVGKTLPRGLCYWLMTKVDHVRKVFIYSPGCEYPLDRSQVSWVLGLPNGPNVVPREVRGDSMSTFVREFTEKYEMVTKKGGRYISIAKVMEVVESNCGCEDEYDFKVAFLALALSDVLCPTTCLRLAKDLIPALFVAKDAVSYDWCDLVMEKLLLSCRHFAKKFYRYGYASGVGGCTYFLAIFYFDRLKRPPVRWGMFPRVKAWTESDVNEAKAEDRLSSLPGSDYGKLEFLDVAYGERHPLASRDTMRPQSLAKEVAMQLLAGMGVGGAELVEQFEVDADPVVDTRKGRTKGRKERRKGPADGSNPYVRRLAKIARMEESKSKRNQMSRSMVEQEGGGYMEGNIERVDGENFFDHGNDMDEVCSVVKACCDGYAAEGENLSLRKIRGSTYLWGVADNPFIGEGVGEECRSNAGLGQFGSPGALVGCCMEAGEVMQESDDLEEQGGVIDEEKMGRSRPRRGMKPSATVLDKDFETEVVPRQNPKLKAKLVKFVCTAGAIIKDERRLEPHEKTQEDVVMLKVGHMFASVVNCYSVVAAVHGGVDDNYVRVAAALYRAVWKEKFGDSGTRYMVDPTFAMRAMQEIGPPSGWNDCRRLVKTYVKGFSKKTADRIHVVFVPVLESSHWWCAAFCLNTDEIWVIDSAAKDPVEAHEDGVCKLCAAMDIFLCALDVTWIPGRLHCWIRKPVLMEPQTDGDSCGVRMLLAVKACASRYKSEVRLAADIEEERGWLLKDDVISDANEVKEDVKRLLAEFDG